MREQWNRSAPALELGLAELTTLVAPAFPGLTVVRAEPTEGGLANTNFQLGLSGGGPPVLLRLFVGDPGTARKEYALSQRVAPHAPVARYLHFAEDNPVTGHPCALLEWVDGVRLEVAALTLAPEQREALGQSVGVALAGIHAVTFPETGFLDAGLNVAHPISVGSDGLVGYLRLCLVEGRGAVSLGPEMTQTIVAFAERETRLLDTWTGPPRLVHGDFGGSNILVHEGSHGWAVAAVLDWEFAFSGSPFFDLGNLLRPPLGEWDAFVQGVHDGYTGAGGTLPTDWRRMSRLADLLSWADFVSRPVLSEALLRDARAAFLRTIQLWASECP